MTVRLRFWIVAGVLLVVALIAGIALGSVRLSPLAVLDALVGTADPMTIAIVRDLRLPRALLAGLVGAALGMAGTAMQGALRNALAEPYLLGISGGAAAGAVTAVALGLTAAAALPLAAFIGALAAVAVVLGVARAGGGGNDPRTLLMAGVIVGAFANAAIMVLLAGASPDATRNALWWMMGSVAHADWQQIGWMSAYAGIAGALLIARARDLDVLALGPESAASLGVDPERASRGAYLLSSALAAASVAAAGLVGFVGLVVPHLVRALGLRGHRDVIAGAAAVGAALVMGADVVARAITPPAELPLGAVTALIGVPFFLARLRRLA